MNPSQLEASLAQEIIAQRAHELWIERGCPIGSPELDWFQAEAELRAEIDPASAAKSQAA